MERVVKISYDAATDSLYVHLVDSASVNSDQVSEGVVLDYDVNGTVVGIDIQHASQCSGQNNEPVKCIYFGDNDIFQIQLSNKPIVREVSPGWHTHFSYAEDGSMVELIYLDAKKVGVLPSGFMNKI
jgi:uncharacterized protein YuzE